MAPKFPIRASVCIAMGPACMARGLGRISHYVSLCWSNVIPPEGV